MDVRDVIERYYRLATAGEWDEWCSLFADDLVMDEQMAGRVEGLNRLRSMMSGFPAMYPTFANRLRELLVDGDRAAVVSRIEATTASERGIEADVMTYFRVTDGRITYLANYHDTAPFRQALDG
jgi:ketosteroid isomerase-like protein